MGHFNSKYCTPVCKSRAAERIKVASGYYQKGHVRQRQNDYSRAKYRQDIATGKESGKLLSLWSTHGVEGMSEISPDCVLEGCERPKFARLKCKPHYQREMLAAGHSWAAADMVSGADHKKRAEKYGVPFEHFDKLDIYVRDNWVCGICAEPVDPDLIYPDSMSASLDHVVPLSRGGAHSPSNTQCSHLSCNVRKGARHGEGIGAGTRVS